MSKVNIFVFQILKICHQARNLHLPLLSKLIFDNSYSSYDTLIYYYRPVVCGGIGGLRPVNEDDLVIWNMVKNIICITQINKTYLFIQYKEHLEKKIQKQFNVPKDHNLKPVQVATQVVAGQNYFFKVFSIIVLFL